MATKGSADLVLIDQEGGSSQDPCCRHTDEAKDLTGRYVVDPFGLETIMPAAQASDADPSMR